MRAFAERAGTDIYAVVGLSGGWRDLPERLLAELLAGSRDAVAVGLGPPSWPGRGTANQKRLPSASGPPGQVRAWTLARVQARLGGARHAVVAEADRRVASVRSRNTAAVAATRAAPRAIKVICQPAMAPEIRGTVAAGSSPPGEITFTAQAAGMMAAEASTAQVRAARAAASRRGRGQPAVLRCAGEVPGGESARTRWSPDARN